VILLPLVIFALIYSLLNPDLNRAEFTATILIVAFIGSIIINPLIWFFSSIFFRTTIGKYFAGLEVRSKLDEKPLLAIVLVFIREFILKGFILQASILIYLDLIFLIANKKNNSAHDLLLRTEIIEVAEKSVKKLAAITFGIIISVAIFSFGYLVSINKPTLAIKDFYASTGIFEETDITEEEFFDDLEIERESETMFQVNYQISESESVSEKLKLDTFLGWWYVEEADIERMNISS
jgi:uncharacterized RDD family membrane protein YckC